LKPDIVHPEGKFIAISKADAELHQKLLKEHALPFDIRMITRIIREELFREAERSFAMRSNVRLWSNSVLEFLSNYKVHGVYPSFDRIAMRFVGSSHHAIGRSLAHDVSSADFDPNGSDGDRVLAAVHLLASASRMRFERDISAAPRKPTFNASGEEVVAPENMFEVVEFFDPVRTKEAVINALNTIKELRLLRQAERAEVLQNIHILTKAATLAREANKAHAKEFTALLTFLTKEYLEWHHVFAEQTVVDDIEFEDFQAALIDNGFPFHEVGDTFVLDGDFEVVWPDKSRREVREMSKATQAYMFNKREIEERAMRDRKDFAAKVSVDVMARGQNGGLTERDIREVSEEVAAFTSKQREELKEQVVVV
jgi:hypothetical protein